MTTIWVEGEGRRKDRSESHAFMHPTNRRRETQYHFNHTGPAKKRVCCYCIPRREGLLVKKLRAFTGMAPQFHGDGTVVVERGSQVFTTTVESSYAIFVASRMHFTSETVRFFTRALVAC